MWPDAAAFGTPMDTHMFYSSFDSNLCFQASRGNAIIAELLRLADNVPEPFLLARKQDQVAIEWRR